MIDGFPAGRVVAVLTPGRETAEDRRARLLPGELSVRILVSDLSLEALPPGTRLRIGAQALVELAPVEPAPGGLPAWAGLVEGGTASPVGVSVLAEGEVAAGDAVEIEAVGLPLTDMLDLHAFRPADVADLVREYIRAARTAGLPEVRIVHGRGRGVQRSVVRQVLEDLPGVAGFADAPPERGGWGATLVRLEPGDGRPTA